MGNGRDRAQGTPEDWLLDELADAADEEVEVELEDAALSRRIAEIYSKAHPDSLPRAVYFRELCGCRRAHQAPGLGGGTAASAW
jgi:hypothetical protein